MLRGADDGKCAGAKVGVVAVLADCRDATRGGVEARAKPGQWLVSMWRCRSTNSGATLPSRELCRNRTAAIGILMCALCALRAECAY